MSQNLYKIFVDLFGVLDKMNRNLNFCLSLLFSENLLEVFISGNIF